MAVRWFLLLLLLTGRPGRAGNTADEADLSFQLGNQAYSRSDFRQALSHYFLSYRLVPNRNVLFNIARCYEALDRFDEAYRYHHDLSEQPLPAEDRREVHRSLARIRPKVALLEVVTEPPGAEVFIDREDLGSRGRSPTTLALPPGPHRVRVALNGHRPAESELILVRGRSVTARSPLELIVGKVSFNGSPVGANIRETPGGPVLGKLPATLSFAPGKRLFYVEAEGFLPSQFLVDLKPDQRTALEVSLWSGPPKQGKVIVTANLENALVRVDGKEAGFTPTVLLLSEGEHTLEISAQERRPFTRSLVVSAEVELKLHAELRYASPEVQAASKSLLSADEAPASITVISSDELRAFGCQTLAEALSAVRGIYLSDDRIYTRLGIRGFSPPGDYNTRVLILWDGHSLNDVWAGQGYAGHELAADLEEVERIEVVRGPGSALYGTGAFFAVINVVPRQHLSGKSVELTGGVGALSSFRGHLSGALGGAGKGVLVSLAGFGANGAEITDLLERGQVLGLDGEKAYTASLSARAGPLTLLAMLNHRQKEIPTGAYGALLHAPGTRSLDSRGFAELRYQQQGERLGFFARGYYDASRYTGHWVQPPAEEEGVSPVFTDFGRGDWLGGEARARLSLFGANRLTLGLEAQHQLTLSQGGMAGEEPAPAPSRQESLASAYLLDEWRVRSWLLLTGGLRGDAYLDRGLRTLTPRFGAVVNPYPGGLTKLVAGSAFRAPNNYELYYSDDNLTQRAAGKLDPERILTLELEHAHELTEELSLSLAGYHNRLSSLVVLKEDPPGELWCGNPPGSAACAVLRNASQPLLALGGETELRWRAGRFAMLNASYSYVRLFGEEATLSSPPSHLLAARLLLPLGESGARVSAQASYQSPRAGEPRSEALLLSFGVLGEWGALRYLASVRNLLDSRYFIPASDEAASRLVPQYGRTFTLQLSAAY